MFSWFKSDPKAKLQKQYEKKMQQAMEAMYKHADRKLHAQRMSEAEEILVQIDALQT